MRIERLRVNHIESPLGFDLGATPTFSWVVADAAGTRPEASRVEVRRAGEVVADTGWANLDAKACSLDVPLAPRTRYEWRVSVRSDAGETASAASWFETGKMGEAWEATWISCDYDEPRHPVFCRTLELSGGPVASARLYVTGLGLFEAAIDARRVGEEHLAPGTHAYDKWLQVHAYDVTDMVRDGARLEIALGHGWYSGRFGFVLSERGFYGADWRLIAELRVTYADGTEEVVGTGPNWQVERSGVLFSNIYDGERRDDTLSPSEPVGATPLDEAEALRSTGLLHDRLSLPVVPHEALSPTLVRTPAGDCVLDVGQNIAGTFRMRVDLPRGATLTLQFAEHMQDGEFCRDNLRTARAEYVYVSAGTPATLEPRFTYYGYRYVRVEVDGAAPAGLDPACFEALVLHSDFDPWRARIVTGSDKVNRLVSNTRWGMRDNFVDTPTDCPQRDERMGWTGDANVFSETALRLGAPYAFFRKYLFDMALEQSARDGMVPAVVPAFGSPFGNGCAVWGDATCRIPWNMYVADGDPAILAEHFGAMCAWVDWVVRLDGDSHLWGSVFQFGDWLALDGPVPGGVMGGTDAGLIAYLSLYDSASIVGDAAAVLGREAEERRYREIAARTRAWIEAEYYTATGRCAVNTQTAYVLSLRHGFGNDAWSASQLRRLIQERGGHLCTGFVGTPALLPALSKAGLDREAFDLLLNEDRPGWLFAVDHGATTVWERWDSLDDRGRLTGVEMNSLNHYSYGAVVGWLADFAAGLTAAEAGYARARIEPHVDWRLGSMDLTMDTAAGTYRVLWECVGEDVLRVGVSVPFGCTAEITLPLATEDAYADLGGRTLGPGTHETTYRTSRPLRRVPSADWTIEQLLDDPRIANAVRPFVDGFDFCTSTCDQRRTLRELQAEGFGQNVKMGDDELERADEALRALADMR